MDIRIIPNKTDVDCRSLNEKWLLLINREKITTNIGTGIVPFSRIYYYTYNVKRNVREEILPDVSKYEVAHFSFAEKNCPYLYYFTINFDHYPNSTFTLFRYNAQDMTCSEVYRYEDNLKEYVLSKHLSVFVLNENYIIMQFEYLKEMASGISGYYEYASFLYDISTGKKHQIRQDNIEKYGLQTILPIVPNVCALKIGYPVLPQGAGKERLTKEEAAQEELCLVTISQFISDIIIGSKGLTRELIDSVYYEESILHVKRHGKYLIYTKARLFDNSVDTVFYQFSTKEVLVVRKENASGKEDNSSFFSLAGRPCVAHYTSKLLEILDVKNKEILLRLPKDSEIVDILHDYIVLQIGKKGLITAQKTYEIYQYPSVKLVSKLKSESLKCISQTATDINLLTK